MKRPVGAVAAAMVLAGVLGLSLSASAEDGPGVSGVHGWRGNWTGLFPNASPPLHWSRTAQSLVSRSACQAKKPADGTPPSGPDVRDGLLREWLVIGPLATADSVGDFEAEQIPGEAGLEPDEGRTVDSLAWKRLELPQKPDYERWGTAELDWVDVGEALGYKPNQVAYAHTYLHCPRPGKLAMVVDHGHGLKLWVNGKPCYACRQQAMALAGYTGISRQKRDLASSPSPRVEFPVQQGWNRILVKVSSTNTRGSRTMKFAARLLDAEPLAYREENLLWAVRLPERTNASPIVIGDRLFTPSEPDELICLDKHTGRMLWRRPNTFWHAIPPEHRQSQPALREKVEPLVRQLEAASGDAKAMELRRSIQEGLIEWDKKEYGLKWDGHLAGHFGIVGFTTTPVSDGKHVWLFLGSGAVACYDLEGNAKWITRLKADEIRYSCSPALVGGKLLCVFGGLHALNAETGSVLWSQPDVTSIASLIPARIRETDVVFTREGKVLRADDGKLLWSNPHIRTGDTGWAAGMVLDEVLYLPWYGVGGLIVADFSRVSGDAWQPEVRYLELDAVCRRPNGEWLDRWTAGSPLVHEGLYYNIDQYGTFYAVDLASGKTLYRHDVGFDELHHYNAIGVGASATLGGRHIFVIDNQGACAVLQPGRELKVVAVNRIESLLPRENPIPPQEILANAAPVFDGPRIYFRGEQYLYCVGEKR